MQNGQKTMMSTHRPKWARPFANRSKQWISNAARAESRGSGNWQRNYERYLALAQAQAQSGDIVGAENYYQHAEHYFRLMSSSRRNDQIAADDVNKARPMSASSSVPRRRESSVEEESSRRVVDRSGK
jgi:hypothetical protein